MTSRRMALVLGSVLALACKYSEPEPQLSGAKEEKLGSDDEHEEPEPANQKKAGTADEAKRTPIEASGACDDRACVADQDCCTGFQCAFDPERSKVQRYCLPN